MEKGCEMEMKLRFDKLCVNVSTWSMVALLGLRHIQVKGQIVRHYDWNTL